MQPIEMPERSNRINQTRTNVSTIRRGRALPAPRAQIVVDVPVERASSHAPRQAPRNRAADDAHPLDRPRDRTRSTAARIAQGTSRHPRMGEADLSGRGRRVPPPIIAAADAPWGRAPGRGTLDNTRSRSERAGDGVDARHLEGFLLRQGRENGRQPPPDVVLPVPGGPGEEEVVRPAAASCERTLPRSCPRTSRSGRSGGSVDPTPGMPGRSPPRRGVAKSRLRDVTHADGVDPGERRLARRVAEAPAASVSPRARRTLRGGDDSADATYPPSAKNWPKCARLTRGGSDQPGGCEHGGPMAASKPVPSLRSAAARGSP